MSEQDTPAPELFARLGGFHPIAGGAEEPEPEPAEDTPPAPEEAAPEATPSEEPSTPAEPEVPEGYIPEDRYNNLRTETDRTKQFIAALEGKQGPEAQQQAYEQLGIQIVDEEADTDDDSPDPLTDLEELKRWRAEQEEAARNYEYEESIRDFADSELQRLDDEFGREFEQDEVEEIMSWANTHPRDDGKPDVEAGAERLKSIYSRAEQRLIKPKQNPAKPGKGTAGVEKDDLSTPEGRRKAIEEAASAAFASE